MVGAAFWPGVAMYDTVAQYRQVVGGPVDDWHPPAMVRMWQALSLLGMGTGPIFALQVALYATGFGLIVAALVRAVRAGAAVAVAVLALSPLPLGWQLVVLKDAQMLGASLAAVGIVAHFRLAKRPVPKAALAGVVLLLAYATLVRANAVFATVPLALLLLDRPRVMMRQAGIGAAVILVILALSPLINHRLLGATPSGVAKSQPLFDLAAIAVATPGGATPFSPAQAAELSRRHCVKPFFWDPLGDPAACAETTAAADALPERDLYADLARAVVAHPLAYAAHRLTHWNSTERWLVSPGLMSAAPPAESEPSDVGLRTPTGALVPVWQDAAAVEAGTPLGWPIVWTVIAVLLLPIAWRHRREPTGGLAFALVISALCLETSFLVVSIASDLRYHLWPMAAAALALILLAQRVRRGHWFVGSGLLALMIAAGLLTRATWPRAPDGYEDMVKWSGA